jgi:outer membrane protein OmpA-like peptidoglycan-associated protein
MSRSAGAGRRSSRFCPLASLAAVTSTVALLTPAAWAQELAREVEAHVDPVLALPVSSPQTSRFGVGGGGWLGGALHVAPYLDAQAQMGLIDLSAHEGSSPGQAFVLGLGPRVQRSREAGWSPWADADVNYVRTGSLDRFGITVAVGATFPLPRVPFLWVGPVVRYLQIVQSNDPGLDARDARVLTFGASVEAIFPTKHEPPPPPPPPPDADGDGIIDSEDKCPTVAGPRENGGCPDVDTDGDTVIDRLDQCPKEPGPPSNHGCPLPDRDGDGVTDDVDRCPDAPGPAALKGCPDRDKDTVPDIDDQCPDVPGTPENHGCPVYKNVQVTGDKVKILQVILFAFGTTKVLPKSLPLLAEVATALRDHSALEVRVEGHTDSVGTPERNLALSKGRAEAVRKVLIDDGISPDRLTAVGFGQTLPIDTNSTAAGREANRRVEFTIVAGSLSTAAPPAPVPTPPPSPSPSPSPSK